VKRFLRDTALFLAIQAVLVIALDAFYMRHFGRTHYMAALLDKAARLQRVPAPRILLVGGSSWAFGVNSAALERALDRPVVNLGLNGGLGLGFMLAQGADAVRPGDVVILSLEYPLFERKEFTDPSTILLALRIDPAAIRFVAPSTVPALLDEGLFPLTVRLRALHAFAKGVGESPLYRRSAFDERGDAVGHRGMASQHGGTQRVFVPSADDAALACRRLAAFAAHVRSRNTTVAITVPAIPSDEYEPQRDRIAALWERVERETGIPVLGVRKTYARDLFLDTPYHLTFEGRGERTRTIIDLARRSLQLPPSTAAVPNPSPSVTEGAP
jgi:hypothetical protein